MSLILTEAGRDLYAQSEVTGDKLQATHMAVGDGGGAPVAHTDKSEALVNETWRGELQEIKRTASGEVEFTGHVPITVGGWYIRELAVYADDTLLALGSHPETWKPAPESPDKVELVITAPVKFANTDNISLTVDTTKVLASQEHVAEMVAEHNADQDAHAAAFAALAQGLGAHAERTDNPHGVTAAQAGAAERVHTHHMADIPDLSILAPGDIVFTAAATPPAGTIKANGATLSRGTYAALFAKIGTIYGAGDGSTTFQIPDFRGEFFRGLDDGRGVDPGRELGSWQEDIFKAHNHHLIDMSKQKMSSGNSWVATSVAGATSVLTSDTGGTETRPRNYALLVCIKY